jgi:uncharacterized protein YjiS (DUF1127 family)
MAALSKISDTESYKSLGLFSRLGDALVGWGVRVAERRTLVELSINSLEDIGLDPDRVEREIARPIWD